MVSIKRLYFLRKEELLVTIRTKYLKKKQLQLEIIELKKELTALNRAQMSAKQLNNLKKT